MICDYVISIHKIHALDPTLNFELLSFHFQFSNFNCFVVHLRIE